MGILEFINGFNSMTPNEIHRIIEGLKEKLEIRLPLKEEEIVNIIRRMIVTPTVLEEESSGIGSFGKNIEFSGRIYDVIRIADINSPSGLYQIMVIDDNTSLHNLIEMITISYDARIYRNIERVNWFTNVSSKNIGRLSWVSWIYVRKGVSSVLQEMEELMNGVLKEDHPL